MIYRWWFSKICCLFSPLAWGLICFQGWIHQLVMVYFNPFLYYWCFFAVVTPGFSATWVFPPLAIVWLDLPEFLGVVCRFLLVFIHRLATKRLPELLIYNYSANITQFFEALEATNLFEIIEWFYWPRCFFVVMFSHSKIKHCIHFVLKKTHCKIRTKTKISPSFEVLYETEGTEVVAHLCLFARGTFCFLGWCLWMTTFVGWWFQILLPFPRDGLRFKHPVRDFLKQLAQRPTSHVLVWHRWWKESDENI